MFPLLYKIESLPNYRCYNTSQGVEVVIALFKSPSIWFRTIEQRHNIICFEDVRVVADLCKLANFMILQVSDGAR